MAGLVFRFLLFSLLTAIPLLGGNVDGQVRTGVRPGLSKPAEVQLLRNGELIAEQFTGLNGRFEFKDIPAGDYVVRITYPGFREEQVPLPVGAAGTSKLDPVTLQPSPKDEYERASTISFDELKIPRAARKEYEAGLRMRQRGKHAEALIHLRKAIASYPKYGEAFNEIGVCLKQTGDLAGAEQAFKSAIEYNSTVYSSISLADLYSSQRRFGEAQRIIRTAMTVNPLEGDLFFALARIYFDQDQVKEAEASALEAHSRPHRAPDVHLLLAKIYLANGNYPRLVTQLETYLDESPEGPFADQVRQNLKQMKTER